MPIEVMANRGEKTMLFGPMKPVGLEDPKTGKRPYAVVQLRQDNLLWFVIQYCWISNAFKMGRTKTDYSDDSLV